MNNNKNKSINKKFHHRNKHNAPYNFEQLVTAHPPLKNFVILNPHNAQTIDFANPLAVKSLNTALLIHFYKIDYWNMPENHLCPPIPGRADYIHYLAELLSHNNHNTIPTGKHINCLDIGVGANCIYPIIGNAEYKWSFTGADIATESIKNAKEIVSKNKNLTDNVNIKLQKNRKDIFKGIISSNEYFDTTLCNPPFHASANDATKGNARKTKNLGLKNKNKLNFGGTNNELWCPGGELKFIGNMIEQSRMFSRSCFWFTTLVSKSDNLKRIYALIDKTGAHDHKTIPMMTGNKTTRIVAWTFLTKKEQEVWRNTRWKATNP